MSLFTGLLQDSKGPTCRKAGTAASASNLALLDSSFNLSLASEPQHARHRVEPAVPVGSSVPRTFCRGSTQALPNSGNKCGSSTLSNAGASFFALNNTSKSEANRARSCRPAAAPAYTAVTDAAGHSNSSSAAKALTRHQLQLSTAKQTRLGGLPTGQASSIGLLPTAGHSSRVWHQHEASNGTAVLDTVAARGQLQRSDITRDSSTMSLQPRSPATCAATVAVAASTDQQAASSVGLHECSADMQQKAQQSKLWQSRPPKSSKHMSLAVLTTPQPSAGTTAAVASNLGARPPKSQECQEKSFQLTRNLFAAGTGSIAAASKPMPAAASAAAGARSCKHPVERPGEGCLLLPLPCSISSSRIACGGAKKKLRGATAARSTVGRAVQRQQTAGLAAAGLEDEDDEFKMDVSGTYKPQQGLLERPQVRRKQQQAPTALDATLPDLEECTRTEDDEQHQQQQKLMQMQQGTDTQQQRKRQKSVLESDDSVPAGDDRETEESDPLNSCQAVGGQRQQPQMASKGHLWPQQHPALQSGRSRPRQRQQQCKHTCAYDSEPDSELEPASSSSPSAHSSSEWSGGSSGTAGDSSNRDSASACSTEDDCRKARPSRASTSTRRNARNENPHGSSSTSVLQKRSASAAAAAADPADAVLQDAGSSKALQQQLLGLQSAAAVAMHAAEVPQQQQQQQRKRAVTWSLLPGLPGQQLPADLMPSQAAAAAADSDDGLYLGGQLRPRPSAAAAAAAAVVDTEGREAVAHPKGHIPLIQPSAAALSRQNVLLIELPACFDAAGDAGSIGRIVCSRQDCPKDSSQDVAAASTVGTDIVPAKGFNLQLLLPQLGNTSSSNVINAAAKLPGPGLKRDSAKQGKKLNGSKRKAQQLLAGLLGDRLSDGNNSCGSDADSQGGTHSNHAESDSLAHAGEGEEANADGTDSDGDAAAAADDREVTAVELDLKGLMFSAVSLPMAGTAAVVRINMAGGNLAKASAQVEHLFNTSYIRAIPAADTAGDGDDPYAAGAFADDTDAEGQEGAAHLMVQDACDLAAGFRDEEDGDIGRSSKGAGVGFRSRGGKSKRGGKSRGGGRLGSKSKAAGGRRVGSKARSTARARGASVRGVNKSKRGAAGIVEAKPAAKEQKQLESWEKSDGDDE